tara:strand:- start:282 stop:461 length:180 start_codon:yes stop_codon:yes gene_type:complete
MSDTITRYGAGGVPYIEKVKPVKVEPVAPVEKTKIKKKPQPLQEIYMDKGFDEDEGDIA